MLDRRHNRSCQRVRRSLHGPTSQEDVLEHQLPREHRHHSKQGLISRGEHPSPRDLTFPEEEQGHSQRNRRQRNRRQRNRRQRNRRQHLRLLELQHRLLSQLFRG